MRIQNQDPASVELRERVILDTLREHPWTTPRMLSTVILRETGGAPALLTGALYIPPWTLYGVLVRLHARGLVERRTINARVVWWRLRDHAA